MPRMGPIVFAAIVLATTFGSGVVVGRLWARQPLVLSSELSNKAAPGAKRGGVAEPEAERPRDAQDRLTFYRTLTAPLGPSPATGRSHPESRARASEGHQAASREAPRADARPAAAVTTAVSASRAAAPGTVVAAATVTEAPGPTVPGRAVKASPSAVTGPPSGEPVPTWAVQVGVFKGKQQAETAHRRLVEGGLQASLTQTLVDGETRYRVRAGAYRTKIEAERVAERVRSERALPTYITAN